jgi:type I restriction enzyme S subunit
VHEKIIKRCNPEENDIIMTTTGTIGNVAIVPKAVPFSMDRGITLMKLDKSYVHPVFIMWLLRFDAMQNIMNANVHASAIGHLFLNKVEQLPVIVPKLELQNQFAAFVAQVDKSKVAAQKMLDEAQLLFDSLMQEYFC